MKSLPSLNPPRAFGQSPIKSGLAMVSSVLLALIACATQRDGPPVRADEVERRVAADAAGAPSGAGAQASDGGGTAAEGGTGNEAGVGNTDSGGQGAEDSGGTSTNATRVLLATRRECLAAVETR